MNTFKPTILVVAIVALSSASYAQVTPGRPVTTGAQNRGGNSNHDATKRQFQNAIHQIELGLKELKGALPIYNGKRVDAMHDGREAIKEIVVGIFKNDGGKAEPESSPFDRDDKHKYSAAQIAKSNQEMLEGAKHYERAISILTKINGDYDGHKAKAVSLLRDALSDIKVGVTSVGGGGPILP